MRKKWFIKKTAEPVENQMVDGIIITGGVEYNGWIYTKV